MVVWFSSVFASEGLMSPLYLQFPRAALSCLSFGLETSLSFWAQWVPHGGAEMSSSCSSWGLGSIRKGLKPKQIPKLSFSNSVTFALCGVKMRGQPGFFVSLCHLLEVVVRLWCLTGVGSYITLLTDIFQFKKKIKNAQFAGPDTGKTVFVISDKLNSWDRGNCFHLSLAGILRFQGGQLFQNRYFPQWLVPVEISHCWTVIQFLISFSFGIPSVHFPWCDPFEGVWF